MLRTYQINDPLPKMFSFYPPPSAYINAPLINLTLQFIIQSLHWTKISIVLLELFRILLLVLHMD